MTEETLPEKYEITAGIYGNEDLDLGIPIHYDLMYEDSFIFGRQKKYIDQNLALPKKMLYVSGPQGCIYMRNGQLTYEDVSTNGSDIHATIEEDGVAATWEKYDITKGYISLLPEDFDGDKAEFLIGFGKRNELEDKVEREITLRIKVEKNKEIPFLDTVPIDEF